MSGFTRRAALTLAAAPTLLLPARALAYQAPAADSLPTYGRLSRDVPVRGRVTRFDATVGEIPLRNSRGELQATMSFTSYALAAVAGQRPVTFLFNGGPLVATIALREGLAPIRSAPGRERGEFILELNPDSLLDVSDLVFVDPPGLGYGRMISETAKADLWGVEHDADAFARFILAWLAENDRRSSPVYLVGESYGGVRSAFLTRALGTRGVDVAGVTQVSPAVSAGRNGFFGLTDQRVGALPTYAAIARFHGRGAHTAVSIPDVAKAAQAFAAGEYTRALQSSSPLSPKRRRAIADKVAGFTGIDAEAILKADLGVPGFGDALVSGERVGREDGRANAPIAEMRKLPFPFDQPDSSMVRDTYDRVLAQDSLYRYGFGYRPRGPFVYLSIEANQVWNSTIAEGSVETPQLLKQEMARNPRLRVLLTGSYFDLAAPYYAALSAFERADLPRDRFRSGLFEAGHAVFYDPVARPLALKALRGLYA